MKNSCLASMLAYWEAMKWNRQRLEASTDVFLSPSSFMAEKMKQGGFDKSKIHILCNFIDVKKTIRQEYNKIIIVLSVDYLMKRGARLW